MSVLETPRVYFKGEIAWDPVTTNNYPSNQAPAGYDEDDCDSTLNAQTVGTANVAAFRQAAIDEIVNKGNWNPAGSYRSPFYDTAISGVDLGQGLDCSRGWLRRALFPRLARVDREAVLKFRARYAPDTLDPAQRDRLVARFAERRERWPKRFGRALRRLILGDG